MSAEADAKPSPPELAYPATSVRTQAVHTAAARYHAGTASLLRPPGVVAALAGATLAGTVGVAAHLAVRPQGPEPALHPRTEPGMVLLEGAMFGFAGAALYVAGRAAWDTWMARTPRFKDDDCP